MAEPLEQRYFKWLCNKVMKVENPTPSLTYWKLLGELHDTEYVWLLSGDDNRAEDGKELRLYFFQEAFLKRDPEWLKQSCSVLEMLIAFAYRAEFMTEETYIFWFWKMLENLGLSEFNDASDATSADVQEILERFIWRTYDEDGTGGLFPIPDPRRDQRQVEVWFQFCDYVVPRR